MAEIVRVVCYFVLTRADHQNKSSEDTNSKRGFVVSNNMGCVPILVYSFNICSKVCTLLPSSAKYILLVQKNLFTFLIHVSGLIVN